MLKIHTFPLGDYQTNCYVIHDDSVRKCCVIDPGYTPETLLQILEHLGLARYFTYIAGAAQDKGRSTKDEVIAYLLEQVGDLDGALMVGDTAYDVIGSAHHGIPCVAVSWGYGTAESLEAAHPAAIVDSTDALLEFILQTK